MATSSLTGDDECTRRKRDVFIKKFRGCMFPRWGARAHTRPHTHTHTYGPNVLILIFELLSRLPTPAARSFATATSPSNDPVEKCTRRANSRLLFYTRFKRDLFVCARPPPHSKHSSAFQFCLVLRVCFATLAHTSFRGPNETSRFHFVPKKTVATTNSRKL